MAEANDNVEGYAEGNYCAKRVEDLRPVHILRLPEGSVDGRDLHDLVGATRSEGVRADQPPPALILDAYRCHLMSSVVDRIQKLGIEVIHIPGGCTGLCQPLDVGVNKPSKYHVWARWEEWMINGIKATGIGSLPSQEEVSAWVAEVLLEMDGLPMIQDA